MVLLTTMALTDSSENKLSFFIRILVRPEHKTN